MKKTLPYILSVSLFVYLIIVFTFASAKSVSYTHLDVYKRQPLHHHFQKTGIPEPKIVTRFWIIGIILAVVTIVTLKIR